MAVTLAQAAALEPSPLRRGTLEMFSQVSTVFDRLPIEPINGAAYAYAKDKVLPGTAFRTVNEAYIESTGLVNQDTESLVDGAERRMWTLSSSGRWTRPPRCCWRTRPA